MDQKLQDRVDQYGPMAAIVKQMYEELGKERTLEIARRGLEKLQVETAQKWAQEAGGNSLQHLADFLQKKAAASDTMDILEVTDKHIATKLTRCVGFEAMDHLGIGDVCRVYCQTDDVLIKAFNPKMKLVRTKTLAGGDDCCDHCWALED